MQHRLVQMAVVLDPEQVPSTSLIYFGKVRKRSGSEKFVANGNGKGAAIGTDATPQLVLAPSIGATVAPGRTPFFAPLVVDSVVRLLAGSSM